MYFIFLKKNYIVKIVIKNLLKNSGNFKLNYFRILYFFLFFFLGFIKLPIAQLNALAKFFKLDDQSITLKPCDYAH